MSDFKTRFRQIVIGERWTIVKKISTGGWSWVYEGRDIETGAEVALKLEHYKVDPSWIELEERYYEKLKGTPGFPKVYWRGEHDEMRILVMELLGPSMKDLLWYCDGWFGAPTTLKIAEQLIIRFGALHRAGMLHCDIKPANCFIGGTRALEDTIYLADLGLVYVWKPHWKVAPRPTADTPLSAVGDRMFASRRGHCGGAKRPQDDLESLGYMLVRFMRKHLPWHGLDTDDLDDHREMLRMKCELDLDQFCKGLPPVLTEFVRLSRSDRPEDEAQLQDYEGWSARFGQAAIETNLAQRGVMPEETKDHTVLFDWTIKLIMVKRIKEGTLSMPQTSAT